MTAGAESAQFRRRTRSLRRRVGLAFAALSATLAMLVTSIVLALDYSIDKGNDVVYRWEPAMARSQALLADLVNQETGVRGFVLTGRSDFLAPYEQYRMQEQSDTAALRQLLRGHRTLLSRLDDFGTAAATWHRDSAESLIVAVRAGQVAVGARLNSDADRMRFDAVRATAAALTTSVTSSTEHAKIARKDALNLLVALLLIAAGVVIAAGLAVWRGLHRWVLGPVDDLAGQTRLVAAGGVNHVIRSTGPPELMNLGSDVERMRRRIAEELTQAHAAREELIRSNADLEQFAYVASHDLSEPLRKVANFCQLLERQYGPQLDDQARQYISFAVDGARRMQALIADLLALSRVGRTTDAFVAVDTGALLDDAVELFEDEIARTGAGVGHSDLPTVKGDRALLAALFENLIGNALKYRGDEPPLIVVTANRVRGDAMWEFAVSDNGIGIDPQYAERIFAIFQRLHQRDEYDGTGIGLAICRKVVEFHGGTIWLDAAESGPGATFRFTLPEGSAGAD